MKMHVKRMFLHVKRRKVFEVAWKDELCVGYGLKIIDN